MGDIHCDNIQRFVFVPEKELETRWWHDAKAIAPELHVGEIRLFRTFAGGSGLPSIIINSIIYRGLNNIIINNIIIKIIIIKNVLKNPQ